MCIPFTLISIRRKIQMKKKVICLLIVITMVMSNISVLATDTIIETKEEFIYELKNNDFYKEYKQFMTTEQPLLTNYLYDEEYNKVGYITQYEVELNSKEVKLENKKELSDTLISIEMTITSLMTFIYYDETNSIEAILIDYTPLGTKEEVHVNYLTTGSLDILPINIIDNEELSNIAKEIKNDKEHLITEYKNDNEELITEFEDYINNNSQITPLRSCQTWRCTDFKSGGGYWDGDCSIVIGAVCSTISYFYELAGAVCSSAGILISCWVPRYKICVAGTWAPVCPY